MTELLLSLQGTLQKKALRLEKTFFGPVSLFIYVLMIALITLLTFDNSDIWLLLLACGFLIFLLRAVDNFIKDLFEGYDFYGNQNNDIFSYDLLREIKIHDQITIYEVIEAAVKNERGKFVLAETGITEKQFLDVYNKNYQTLNFSLAEFINRARENAVKLNERSLNAKIVIITVCELIPAYDILLAENDISIIDLEQIIRWEKLLRSVKKRFSFDNLFDRLKTAGAWGRNWSSGYTNMLDELTEDIGTGLSMAAAKKVQIHLEEKKRLITLLAGQQYNDILIIGENGIGKKTLIENAVLNIRISEKKHHQTFTRLLKLKPEMLVSGKRNADVFLFQALQKAQKAGRFLMVIDHLPQLLKSSDEKLKQVLFKLLKEKNIQILSLTTPKEYHQNIKNDALLNEIFEKVYLEEPGRKDVMAVLVEKVYNLEKKYRHINIPYITLKEVFNLSKRYIGQPAFPKKALQVLMEAVLLAKAEKSNQVTGKEVKRVVSRLANVQVNNLDEEGKYQLKNLESDLLNEIYGQNEAVKVLVSALKRSKTNVQSENKPIGTFLFLGPTGVGKTYTTKVLARHYFGGEQHLIRLDMNEYSTLECTGYIIGTGTAGSEQSFLLKNIQDNPASLILLDEIEKAHPAVLNLFLQILDEGELTDAFGTKTNFKNSIIVATSNAGAVFLRDLLKGNPALRAKELKELLRDHLIKERLFSPEFLNRFDQVVTFMPLNKDHAKQIVFIYLEELKKRLLRQNGIIVSFGDGVAEYLVQLGYSIEFGARELRRIVQEKVETLVAERTLKEKVKEMVVRKEDL